MRLQVVRGNSIRLPAEFFSGDLPSDPLNPRVRILGPANTVMVSNAVPYRNGAGLYHYDYHVPPDALAGAWAAHWSGTINGEIVGGVDGFEVLSEEVPLLDERELVAVVPSSSRIDQRRRALPPGGESPPRSGPLSEPAVAAPVTKAVAAKKATKGKKESAKRPRPTRVTKIVLGICLAVGVIALALVFKSPPSSSARAFQLAEDALRTGATEQAKIYYLSIIDQDPDNKFAYFNLGIIAQSGGRGSEAAYYYRRALARDLNFLPALFNLAILEEVAGRNLEAGVIYRQILRSHPDHAGTHFNLGLLLKNKLGNPDEGQAEINEALRLDPSLSARIGTMDRPQSG
ncbi:MAG: tetratricopeptide repeat protein [Actinomycetota bacterium]